MGKLISINDVYKYKLKLRGENMMNKENFKPIMATPPLSGKDVEVIIERLDTKPSKIIQARSKKRSSVLSKFL